MDDIANPIINWHQSNYRNYPWRSEPTPYNVMIAEFMLQRTRADQVVPVYTKFIKSYPDVKSLAVANLKEIERLLKPLGLYWRAAHFKKAAEYILEYFKGEIPSNRNDLLKIPGIGEYIAGAILAIAYNQGTIIVDSNIARVLNRYYGLKLEGEIRRKREIEKLSEELFTDNPPKEMLLAIIDLSALICVPTNPKHNICPLRYTCKSSDML